VHKFSKASEGKEKKAGKSGLPSYIRAGGRRRDRPEEKNDPTWKVGRKGGGNVKVYYRGNQSENYKGVKNEGPLKVHV